MLFDLFLTTKVSIKIEYPNKILFFLLKIYVCSLKIAVCAPKITIISKNYRLKITEWSKNYGLKIPVRVRMYARMYARAYDCSTTQEGRTRTSGTPPEKGGTPAKQNLLLSGDLHGKS